MNTLKALSVRLPWSFLIVVGLKRFETRTWNTRYRGDVLIQSAKSVDWEAYYWLREFAGKNNMMSLQRALKECMSDMVVGAVIGKATVVGSRPMTEADFSGALCQPYPNAHVHEMVNPKRLEPIHIKGKLNYFDTEITEDQLVYI